MDHKPLRDTLAGLPIFFAVAREGSFTRAAAQLGVSQTSVSHAMRALETRLGVRLLARNSRTVTPTEAGELLLRSVAPEMAAIDQAFEALSELRDSPTGTIRISASDHAIQAVLMSRLKAFLPRYPDIKVELFTDNGFVDIVAERFDAGVRLGESLAQDMIAVRIGPDAAFAAVASPAYLAGRTLPQQPGDLLSHNCINIRLAARGNLWPWEFEKDGDTLHLKVDGQMAFNSTLDCVEAALGGLGIAYVPQELVSAHVQSGQLVRLLQDWCPVWPGLHLYYPSRRQPSGAMALMIAALRYEQPGT